MKVFINDQYFDKEQATVSVFDHGLLYGDGVFEGIRIYNSRIFKLAEHIDRLFNSAKAINLVIPKSRQEMIRKVQETVTVNQKNNGYIRLVVTRGVGNLGIDPQSCPKATIIIIVDDIQLYPAEYYQEGIAVITSSTRRITSDSLDPRIKSLNYLNNILAKIEAHQAGVLESIMLNREGYVAECTADNIFIIKDHQLLTPASYLGALEGITMKTILQLAEKIGIETQSAALTSYDLYNADECFITGTGAEIMPVVKIDGRVIGDGKPGTITQKLHKQFIKMID